MYIYHALINALSTHMIHINLNIIFHTHVEHSPTKTIYIKYYKIKIRTTNTHSTHTLTRLMAFAPSLALDPTFGIHSNKTLDIAQPCHLSRTENLLLLAVFPS